MHCSLLQKADPPTPTKATPTQAVCEVGVDGDTCGEGKFCQLDTGACHMPSDASGHYAWMPDMCTANGALCVGVTVAPTRMIAQLVSQASVCLSGVTAILPPRHKRPLPPLMDTNSVAWGAAKIPKGFLSLCHDHWRDR